MHSVPKKLLCLVLWWHQLVCMVGGEDGYIDLKMEEIIGVEGLESTVETRFVWFEVEEFAPEAFGMSNIIFVLLKSVKLASFRVTYSQQRAFHTTVRFWVEMKDGLVEREEIFPFRKNINISSRNTGSSNVKRHLPIALFCLIVYHNTYPVSGRLIRQETKNYCATLIPM